MDDRITAIVLLRCVLRLRAALLGTYPSSWAIAKMRAVVAVPTRVLPCNARDTVDGETLAVRAIS
jgi:hypothetical protein